MSSLSGAHPEPLVSIVTPAYRAERFLEETVRSVQAQTFAGWEMIIVNDGSPDGTAELADRLAREDSRIRVFHREKASGRPAVPRNIALGYARGRYIAFLDADDLWVPTKLEKQLALFVRSDAAIVYSHYLRMDEGGRPLSQVIAPMHTDYRQMLRSSRIGFLTSMVDRQKTGDFAFDESPRLRGREDYVLWLQLLRNNHRAVCVPEILAHYRVVGDSVSRNKLHASRAQWYVYRRVEKLSVFVSAMQWILYAIHGLRRNLR